MSEWQPIETAPADVNLVLGHWNIWDGDNRWRERNGMAFESGFLGRKKMTYLGKEATHWKHVPPPPKEPEPTPDTLPSKSDH